MNKKQVTDTVARFLTPLIYLFLWYSVPLWLFGLDHIDIKMLTWAALPVLFIGVISRQTSWSIFGDYGIKGDNIGKKIKGCIDRHGSFEIAGYDLDTRQIEKFINAIKENRPPDINNN